MVHCHSGVELSPSSSSVVPPDTCTGPGNALAFAFGLGAAKMVIGKGGLPMEMVLPENICIRASRVIPGIIIGAGGGGEAGMVFTATILKPPGGIAGIFFSATGVGIGGLTDVAMPILGCSFGFILRIHLLHGSTDHGIEGMIVPDPLLTLPFHWLPKARMLSMKPLLLPLLMFLTLGIGPSSPFLG